MATPDDISIPANSKYVNFTEHDLAYNPEWDITWSFEFSAVGTNHGFCTFLSNTPTLSGLYPGQYLAYGYSDIQYLLTEDSENMITENDEFIVLEDSFLSGGLLGIAFDTTGLFALSSNVRPGVGIDSISANSLIIRGDSNNVIYNRQLSSLNTEFFIASAQKNYQTLRFRYANGGSKLSIDFKSDDTEYINLVTIPLKLSIDPTSDIYVGFSYATPVSGINSPISTLYLKNFHTQGNTNEPTHETLKFIPLTSSESSQYTTLTGISAFPMNNDIHTYNMVYLITGEQVYLNNGNYITLYN